MFEVGKKYRHRNCTDIDIVVSGVWHLNEGIVTLEVAYWNRLYNAYAHSKLELVTIKLEDYKNWSLVEEN